MGDTVIQVEKLWKEYRLGTISHQALTRDLQSWWARVRGKEDPNSLVGNSTKQLSKERFWALQDVSFEVKQGDILGIIGRNGAGKSTLLKILSQVTSPTKGLIRFKGRLASLLEVGTGFHPELTGRENIFLNGAILGMSKADLRKKIDEIVDFAEIEKFLDTPVKRYSSGMYVRLAFAVAAHLEPEILLVDEVLAVGDAQFQKKCLGKMEDVSVKEGRTVLFVSHQLDMIRSLCTKVILLDCGQIVRQDNAYVVTKLYEESPSIKNDSCLFVLDENNAIPIQILSGKITNNIGEYQRLFDIESPIVFEFQYIVRKPVQGAIVNFEIKRNNITIFYSFDTDIIPDRLNRREPGKYKARITLPRPLLKPGFYTVSPGTGIANVIKFQQLEDILSFEVSLLSKPGTFLSYSDKRPGVVAVPLDWDTEIIG